MTSRVENINNEIIRQCREQMGLGILDVQKKVPQISQIEEGNGFPTFKQLDVLSELYRVPRWVFISSEIPKEYRISSAVQDFRKLSDSNVEIFSDAKIRTLTAKVERFRELIIDLRNDMHEPVQPFNGPDISREMIGEDAGKILRKWLEVKTNALQFEDWKLLVERRGIFVFMTSKYKGWSHVDLTLFRGMTIFHSKLPIILINDSDGKKARTFTLLHELGHIVCKKSTIDDWGIRDNSDEKWCDEMAGSTLMPAKEFLNAANNVSDLNGIKRLSRGFGGSIYACLVRLRQLNVIDKQTYISLEKTLFNEFDLLKKKLKEADGGPSRNRAKEIIEQYGHIYTGTLFQAFHNKEIGLHKLTKLFGLKKTTLALEVEGCL
jgi:Zn-dependent peptidase ImmA (M78 family)